MKSVTIREVAREAGVSVATISRYINKNGYLGKETEEKIKVVMERLDYRPNEIARGLAKKKTNTIALFIPDITNPFFPELVVAIEEVARAKGYSLILVNTEKDDLENNSFWRGFQNRYVDGFIIAPFQFDKEKLTEMEKLNIPYVKIDRAADSQSPNSVGVNNYKGAKLATEHLIEIGCKKIAHITGPREFNTVIERKNGYMDTIKSHFSTEDILLYEGDFTLESGIRITRQIFEEHPDVDGIFLQNDLMAIGSLKQLKVLKKQVPKEVAIIGFDGIKLTELVDPEISTIQQPIYDIGVTATNKLINLIDNSNETSNELELELKLVKRESTLGFGASK